MNKVEKVDVGINNLQIFRDLSVAIEEKQPGPPRRIDGLTVGFVEMQQAPPHGGEMHPDGDEILHVLAGRLLLVYDSAQDQPLQLCAGDTCVIRQGEWHRLQVLEPAKLIHITPGPRGEARSVER